MFENLSLKQPHMPILQNILKCSHSNFSLSLSLTALFIDLDDGTELQIRCSQLPNSVHSPSTKFLNFKRLVSHLRSHAWGKSFQDLRMVQIK